MSGQNSEKHVDTWIPPEGYYPWVAEKRANPILHSLSIFATSTALRLRHGTPELVVPDTVRELEGSAIFVPTHRSAVDTLVVPHSLERIGFHHARVIAKGSLFKKTVSKWFMHNNGAIAVNRQTPDLKGLEAALENTFGAGISSIVFSEGERIHQNTLSVAQLKSFVGGMAVKTGTPIITIGASGFSKEINEQDEVVAKDKWSSFGIGPPVVAVFSEPIYAEKIASAPGPNNRAILRKQMKATREVMKRVAESSQHCLDEAYRIRGSALEKTYSVYGDGSDSY